ncbi:cobalamin B12-binding domain-containing protein [Desulfospira joergensenii]|uniref:cobalamin B12-binding domain-containing protein n=1 Tax=Desulfospira joergensenii TaxID=53329 RepID=UPI0003B7672D|nr:cobalamin-dependent protein [Desulfospira joergensenii]
MKLLKEILETYYNAVFDSNRDKAVEIVKTAVDNGIKPEEIVFKIVVPTIERLLTDLTEKQDATLAQHFICSKVSAEVTDAMIPLFAKKQAKKGRILLGTAMGDFHGLGKKIVAGCLKAHMFEVHDLGINVAPEKFVDEAVRLDADVIGVSSMMVHSARGEKGAAGVRKLLRERDLEGRIKLVVGGAPYQFDHKLYEIVGADAFAENGIEAVKIIENLVP